MPRRKPIRPMTASDKFRADNAKLYFLVNDPKWLQARREQKERESERRWEIVVKTLRAGEFEDIDSYSKELVFDDRSDRFVKVPNSIAIGIALDHALRDYNQSLARIKVSRAIHIREMRRCYDCACALMRSVEELSPAVRDFLQRSDFDLILPVRELDLWAMELEDNMDELAKDSDGRPPIATARKNFICELGRIFDLAANKEFCQVAFKDAITGQPDLPITYAKRRIAFISCFIKWYETVETVPMNPFESWHFLPPKTFKGTNELKKILGMKWSPPRADTYIVID